MAEYIHNRRIIIKTVVLISTLIGMIGGLTLLIMGGSDYNEMEAYQQISGENRRSANPSLPLIYFGAFVVLISVFGGCSIQIERKWMLLSYTSALFLIAVIQIGLGVDYIVSTRNDDQLPIRVQRGLYSNLPKYYHNDTTFRSNSKFEDIWNTLQKHFHCCGVSGYENWNNHEQSGKYVPNSCCRKEMKGCSAVLDKSEFEARQFVYTKGCSKLLAEFLLAEKNFMATIITGVIELCIVFLTYYLDDKYRGKARYSTPT